MGMDGLTYAGTNVSLYFSYDATGNVVSVDYSNNGGTSSTTYYYVRNAQGDIIGLVNSSGKRVVTYEYDTWGKLLSITGSLPNSLGTLNPFRYRGYVYDTETGWYYLQSRYYDPELGRFISSDVYLSTGQGIIGHNAYAYCGNNPVSREDTEGEFWNLVIGGVVGAIVGGVSAAINSIQTTGEINIGSVLIGAGVGAIGGVVGATGLSAGVQAAISGVTSFASNIADHAIAGEEIDLIDALADGFISAGCSLIGSFATKNIANQAEKSSKIALNRVVKGIDKLGDSSKKPNKQLRRSVKLFGRYIHELNITKGQASVIGSLSSFSMSMGKTIIETY